MLAISSTENLKNLDKIKIEHLKHTIPGEKSKVDENLPVIIIQDWTTVTEEFLNTQYEIILKNIDQYNFDILYTPHWTKMLSSKKKDHDVGCPPL